MSGDHTETLVIGGGLAGAAAALHLARAGRPVRILEREAGPHDKVCGEFLSVEAHRDLAALGLDPMRLGAVPIDTVRLVAHGREITARLPFTALGLSRRVLDEALLDAAASAGAIVERGVRVLGLTDAGARTSLGERTGHPVLLATGKHALRGVPDAAEREACAYVGFKLHWRLPTPAAARLAGAIELLLFDGGYAGLQLVAPRIANLCLVVRRDRLAALGGSWEALLAHLLAEPAFARRLADAEPLFARPLTIANLPYGRIHRPSRDEGAGALFRLGDQAAMTASLTGDGMAAALTGARLAASAILTGGSPEAYYRRLHAAVGPQVRRAMLLQRATELPLALRLGLAAFRLRPALLGTFAAATRLPAWRHRGTDVCAPLRP